MTVDASCRLSLLFLSGSSQESFFLENSSIVVVYHFRYFFSRYPLSLKAKLKLGHVVIDFPRVVAPWFRQNLDPPGGGVLPYKGLMGTCGQPGMFFGIFVLNRVSILSFFVLNTVSFLGR